MKITWRNATRSIDDLKPASYNPRKFTDKQLAELTKSIDRFSLADPIIINADNSVIGGHLRLRALKAQGVEIVDVREPDRQLSDSEEKELNIRLNKNTGDFDLDLLSHFDDAFLTDIGFDSAELDRIMTYRPDIGLTDEDDVPETTETICKSGDLWQLGDHRLLCGDSTKREDMDRLMDGKKADMVFTDPPYGVSYGDKNTYLNSISRGNRIQTPIENDHVSEEEIKMFWKASFEVLRDNLSQINSYYIFGPQIQGMMMMMMMMMMMEAGLPYRHVIIWVKNNHVLGRCDYNYKHEPLFFGWTGTHKFYGAGQFQTSVWEVDKPLKSELHPTMKPIALMENALLNSTERGQICLDPFLGSGSTLIACEKTARICYGIEIDEHYADVIIKRWETFTGRKAERLS